MSVFKTYDVRGVYPLEINEDVALKVGKAYVQFLKLRGKKIIVGQDARKSSPSLYKSLVKGITEQGGHVVNIGMVTTPMLNFAVAVGLGDAGIMISASHNPKEYNAFKLIKKGPLQVHSIEIAKIESLVKQNKFKEEKIKGKIETYDILPVYLEHLKLNSVFKKKIKIVIDYGNGVGSVSAKPFFKETKHDVVELYDRPDGDFPNHAANPHDLENFNEIKKRIITEKADLGIFFDGDADRSIFLDEKAQIIEPDLMLCLFSKYLLKEQKKAKYKNVYYDLRFSKIAEETIKKYGGKPNMLRVGNPFYKEVLRTKGGFLAGEFSGHFMFSKNYNIDDGLFCSIELLNIFDRLKKPLSEEIAQFKKYATSPEINLKVSNPEQVFKKIKEEFKNELDYKNKKVKPLELDGLSYYLGDWWFNIRKSNTEPLVRLRIEANSKKLLDEKTKYLKKLLQ